MLSFDFKGALVKGNDGKVRWKVNPTFTWDPWIHHAKHVSSGEKSMRKTQRCEVPCHSKEDFRPVQTTDQKHTGQNKSEQCNLALEKRIEDLLDSPVKCGISEISDVNILFKKFLLNEFVYSDPTVSSSPGICPQPWQLSHQKQI